MCHSTLSPCQVSLVHLTKLSYRDGIYRHRLWYRQITVSDVLPCPMLFRRRIWLLGMWNFWGNISINSFWAISIVSGTVTEIYMTITIQHDYHCISCDYHMTVTVYHMNITRLLLYTMCFYSWHLHQLWHIISIKGQHHISSLTMTIQVYMYHYIYYLVLSNLLLLLMMIMICLYSIYLLYSLTYFLLTGPHWPEPQI